MNFTHLDNLILTIGKEAANALINKLKTNNSVATGNLIAACHPVIQKDLEAIAMVINLPEYAEYLDKGTKPRKAGSGGFNEAIRKWVAVKGLPPQSTFPIARSIWDNGTSPHPFLIEYDNVVQFFLTSNTIEIAIEDDVTEELRRFISN